MVENAFTIDVRVLPFCEDAEKELRLPWELGLDLLEHLLNSDMWWRIPELSIFLEDHFVRRLHVLKEENKTREEN